MNVGALEKQIGRIERATACPMCELLKRHWPRVEALIAEVAAGMPEVSETARYTAGSFCAWCGVAEERERETAAEDVADLDTFYQGINTGRWCAPEVRAALDRLNARLRGWFGPRYGDYEAIYDDFSAEVRTLPPPRFPYVCRVPGCLCANPKRAAA